MPRTTRRALAAAFAGLGTLLTVSSASAQILETETARPIGKGVLEASGNFEYQTSSEGHETAIPFAVEYGATDRLELLLEPVAYTAIRPKVGPAATGGGDLEATATYLVRRETSRTPAFALAGEVKFPTTKNTLIGTGRTDYAGYLIASRRFGRLETHANFGYTIVGKPAGAQLKNVFNFAFGWERGLGASSELFGEFLANTASSSAGEAAITPTSGATPAEAPTGEIIASFGFARYVVRSTRLSLGLSVDNNGAVLLRPGFTFRLR